MVTGNNEKSEAQLRNEKEVRRIMEERGFSSAPSKKQIKKTFGGGSHLKTFIASFLIAGLLAGGWVFIQNNSFNNLLKGEQNEDKYNEKTVTKDDDESIKFQACLSQVDTSDIGFDDAEFWDKYIDRYEQILACYDAYPSVADSADKEELRDRLTEIQESSRQVEANNAEYRANMAQIDAELERNLAKIKEEEEAWDAELLKRVQESQAERAERDAQYAREQAEREAKQAKCNSFMADYPDINTYKTKNGNLDELWDQYQAAKEEYNHALSIGSSAAASGLEARIRVAEKTIDEKRAAMDSAHNLWSFTNTRLSSEYNSKYREACL